MVDINSSRCISYARQIRAIVYLLSAHIFNHFLYTYFFTYHMYSRVFLNVSLVFERLILHGRSLPTFSTLNSIFFYFLTCLLTD